MSALTLPDTQRAALMNEDGWLRQFGDEAMAVAAGQFPRNGNAYAYVAGLLVKAGAASLYGFCGYNSGPAQFILCFDEASFAGLSSSSIPEIFITVPTLNNFSYSAGTNGRRFQQGIVLANSSTAVTYTAGSANCWFDVQYV